MLTPYFSVNVLAIVAVMLGMTTACAQDYPSKTIRIVTASVGGGSDYTARVIAQGLSAPLGQQVIVDNRPSSNIPGELVSKAAPDGYTLLVGSNSLWLAPFIQDNVRYDPVRDFSPIAEVASSPSFLVVHPSLPVKSVKELIVLAQAKSGQLNYGSGTTAGADHLAAELFKAMAHVDMVRIAYKTTSVKMADLVGGQVHLSFGPASSVAPHVKARRLRALGVTSAKTSAQFPDIPTVAATVPGYESLQILGIWAPAKTPAAVINRLNQEIVRALGKAEIRERFVSLSVDTVGGSPEQFAAAIKSDMVKMGKVIKDAGIREE